MAKIKLQLTANPTFKADVAIPIAGAAPVKVQFTFKHRNKEALKEFFDTMGDKDDPSLVMEMCSGWELDDAFDVENVQKLVSEYVGSAAAILETYIAQSTGAAHRVKN